MYPKINKKNVSLIWDSPKRTGHSSLLSMRLNLRYFNYCFLGGDTLFWKVGTEVWRNLLYALMMKGLFRFNREDDGNTLFRNDNDRLSN
jgi:hypothetical protein